MVVAVADYIRTQGGRLHSLVAQLSDTGGPLDIPIGTQATFGGHLLGDPTTRIGGTAVIIRAGAEPDDPNRGLVRYDLSTQDVAIAGMFYCQWTLTPPGSTLSSPFPEDGAEILVVLAAA